MVVSLVAFGSILTDTHLNEFSSDPSSGCADTCCVTCCPTHNLGQVAAPVTPASDERLLWPIVPVIAFYSELIVASLFDPPRLVA